MSDATGNWMMFGMGSLGLGFAIFLILGIASLAKYLLSKR